MEPITKEKIAQRIIHLRNGKNISQVNLATKIGISQESISSIETAKSFPKMSTLLGLCEFFDCSLDYLVGLSEIKKPAISSTQLNTHEQYLIESYNRCSEKNKDLILLICRILANNNITIEFNDETSIIKNYLSFYDAE